MILNKVNVVAVVISGMFMSPLMVNAGDDTKVNGFIDVIGNSDSQPVFGADAEIDVSKKMGAVTVRVDFDANLAANGGTSVAGGDSGRLEQAYFAWEAMQGVTVLGGLFNSPVGQELEDAPDMDFTSHSVVWNILDGQTALYGNNVAGVAAAGSMGPATITLAVVDDIGLATSGTGADVKGKTSVALVVNVDPMPGLTFELGYVSQDDQEDVTSTPTTAGNVTDINAAFNAGPVTVGLDYLLADNIVDSAANVWAGFDVSDKLNLKVRYETVAFETSGVDDSTRTTLYATFGINDNLSVALETSSGDNGSGEAASGIADDDVSTLEFIGTF